VGFDNQIAAIERTLKAKEKDLEELLLMSHDAQHAKEVAKAELGGLERQLAEEKKQREKEVAERRLLVQQKMEMNQKLEKRVQESSASPHLLRRSKREMLRATALKATRT
jgi:coiled-coil domain-containing protein 151